LGLLELGTKVPMKILWLEERSWIGSHSRTLVKTFQLVLQIMKVSFSLRVVNQYLNAGIGAPCAGQTKANFVA
jgi:hypothetical protein